MARSGSSSRFVSVNLSKSYGQSQSPLPGSILSGSASSSSAYRTRLQSGHSGMTVLSRPGRSQPSPSSTTSRTSKLVVPSPVNLPSRRREHAGNDPTVVLVGASGLSGWSKQQQPALPADSVMAVRSIPAETTAVRSKPIAPESRWSSPASQGRVSEQQESFYQASTQKLTLCTPSSSLNANALKTVPAQASEKVMIVRGEDFPTLQAAAHPFVVPALQRQRDLQQKQQDKQHEIKDQHMKLQQLSQQQNGKADDVQAEHYAGPQLQPVRPQVISKQPVGREGQRYEMRHTAERRVMDSYGGPSPLIRLTHTSNWADDERETLQSIHPQASMQLDRLEPGRPLDAYHLSDSRTMDHKGATDLGRPASRNGSLSGYSRDFRDSRNHDRNGSFGFESRSTRDMGLSNGMVKGFPNKQLDVDSWEDIASWSRGPGRSDLMKRDWNSPAKEINHDRDARLGNSGRSFSSRNVGLERDMKTNARRDADPTQRGDNFGLNMSTREVHSRDGSNRMNGYFSKHGVNDWSRDRPRKSSGNHQLSPNVRHAQNDLSELDYGREKRVPVLYGQDPFSEDLLSSKPDSSLVLEAFVGMSGLEAKMLRRKKDKPQNFRDPARELFEAELERVQKVQEQERQRLAEEREKAIELARKEEEEREKLAKEEELLRLKLEEEAREATAQAQRNVEEAARKAEEIRRAREEEKRMAILEEERRKEAARRKLLDLEQRIAQRESLQQQKSYSGAEVSVGSFEMARRLEEGEHKAVPSSNKFDLSEECALTRGPTSVYAKKESVNNLRPMSMDSNMRPPADTRGGERFSADRSRIVQMKKRETLELGDVPVLPLSVKKYHLRDDPPWSEHEREYREFSLRDSSTGPSRSFPSGASQSSSLAHQQDRVHGDPFTRKEQWQSGHHERFSGGCLSTDSNAGDINPALERDHDGWWGRDNRRRFQEGQRLNSPPLPFHMNGEETDFPSFGRLRQSLPKQPRVPLPIFGRPTSHKQVIQSETMPALSSPYPSDDSEDRLKDSINSGSEEVISENNLEKADYVDKLLMEAPVVSIEENSVLAVPIKDLMPLQHAMKVADETDKAMLIGSQSCKDEISQPDEIDQFSEQLSDLTESEDRLGEDEKLAVDVQLVRTVESADDQDGWPVQAKTEDMGEEVCANEGENELAVEDETDDQEWDSSKALEDVTINIEHGTEKKELDEVTWESQHIEDEGDGVVDDPEGAADMQWRSKELFAPKIETQDDTELKDLAVQDPVTDHVVQLQNVLSSASTLNFAQAGQSEGHNHGQSFLQHFQQPFSFMAIPLSQSTALNGVTPHPPMLPSMHSLQGHQELPYHLQLGLLPGTSLMPNAIQIGSIQMSLQVPQQMPPLAHIHHQQGPVFQFGQLCPFSPPLPPMQPAVQVHHAMGHPPLSAQHHQAEFLTPEEGSHFPKFNEAVKQPEEMSVQSSHVLKSLVENPADSFLGGCLSSVEHVDRNSTIGSVTSAQTTLPPAGTGDDAPIGADQATSVGKIIGGRRRNSNIRISAGINGRGRGRLHSGKNHDRRGPYSVSETWPGNTTKELVRNRTYRQTFRRAEYKIRKPRVTSDTDPEFSVDQGNHVSSYGKAVNAPDVLKSTERSAAEGALESRSYLYSQSLEGSNTQHDEALPGLQSPHVGFGSVQADGGPTGILKSTTTISTPTKGNIYNSEDLGDASLQSGVTFAFDEQGNEVQNDQDDDFIEVRSKRQLLREQRELRDKTKSKELKYKEQVARKQQKVIVKSGLHEEAGKEKLSALNGEVAINEGMGLKQLPAVIGSSLEQFCAAPTLIGLSAPDPSEFKSSKSGQYQGVAAATHTNTGKGHAFGYQFCNDALDTATTTNAAWGVQKSSPEVVSLMQIQLEEAMKPFGFDGISSQMTPISERGSTVMGQGISLASCSLNKVSVPVKASTSMPGPISSLLAGEKIQFGAVTSPTVISSSSHPPSPSFIGAIGSQFGADGANFSSHPITHARNYFGQDKNGAFLSGKLITRVDDDGHRQLADSEAEAEAAASAVAVAAISNDDTAGNHSDLSIPLGGGAPVGPFTSFSKSSGHDGTGAGIIQAPSKVLGGDGSISVTLPADLSLETPISLQQTLLPSHPVSSEIAMQSLPSRASPFPCLEMGTILRAPIFAYGPRDDATFEPGFAGIGAGSITGWQYRHSNTSDSFYGAPPSFISPAGLPSMQGHPHMLVYTNPFTPVGQFGQLGLSFMGTAYHPSGKQPDWTYTPYTTSPGAMNQSGGDVNARLPVMVDPQHSRVASISPQAISVPMMPVPTPANHFDPKFSSSFQGQWSRAPSSPFSNYHVVGHISDHSHQLPEISGLHLSGDAAAAASGIPGVHFPDELGFGYPVIPSNSILTNVEILSNSLSSEVPGSNLQQQSQNIPQNIHVNLNAASVGSMNKPCLVIQDARGSQVEPLDVQINDLEQQRGLGHLPTTSPLMDKRASLPQVQARGGSVDDYQRRGSSHAAVSTVSVGERGPTSSVKPKQIYVAKPALTSIRVMDAP